MVSFRAVNGKSIREVLTLGVSRGDRVEITAAGDDEGLTAAALGKLIRSNFASASCPAKG